MIHNRKIAFVFRVLSLLIAIGGLCTHVGIFSGQFYPKIFMYYTIQSNCLGVILFALLTYKTYKGLKNDGEKGSAGYLSRFEMVCVIDLLLTLIVFWVMLAPRMFSMGGDFQLWNFSNLSVHLITPALCLVDYILFTDSHHLFYRDVYYVLIYPLSYVLFTSITGLLGFVFSISPADGLPVHYPYFFFDYDRIGASAIIYILGLVMFFLFLSHILYIFDKKVTKPVIKK